MYLILAIILVVLFYNKWFASQKSIIYFSYFLTLLFSISIFLCASKLGLISFVIILPILILYKLKALLNTKKIILILFGFIILIAFSSKLFPAVFTRLNSIITFNVNQLDKTSIESTTVRFLIWQEALVLIKQNILFGVSVGDTNDALYNSYQQNGITGALEHKLNAHNQFMQTFIGMGIVGFFSLLLITLWQLIKSIIKKHFLLFIFSLLIILNFLVESMLQSMSGTLFFVFFYCIFNLTSIKQISNE
ncbi:MAG: O-antigen ligase family protein [Bacteroidota bacterium]|nr:O-antigen ligase family protein [Bacteroidota bacterium]